MSTDRIEAATHALRGEIPEDARSLWIAMARAVLAALKGDTP